ncbi:MAG: O-antigen ligase family protein [Armatimonadota bacterium]
MRLARRIVDSVASLALVLVRTIRGKGNTRYSYIRIALFKTRFFLASPWRRAIRFSLAIVGLGLFLGIHIVLGRAISNLERWWFLIIISFVSLGAGILAVRNVVLMIAIWLVLVPWTWHFPVRSAKYYFGFDLLAITLVFIIVITKTLARRVRLYPLNTAEWLLLLSIVYVNAWPVLQKGIAEGWRLGTMGSFWTLLLVPPVFYFVFRMALESERSIRIIIYTMVAIGTLWTISGFYEHYTGYQWHSALTGRPVLLEWRDIAKGRAIGPSGGQLQPGIVLTATILMTLHVAGSARRMSARLAYYVLAGLMAVALFFTYTRTSYAAFVISLIAMIILGRGCRARYISSMAILAGVLIAMAPALMGSREFFTRIADPSNYYGRLAMSRTAWNIVKDHFLFGAGDLRDQSLLFRYVSSWYHPGGKHGEPYYYPDNDYLVVLGERGIFGFLLYYGAIIGFVLVFLRYRNELPNEGLLGTNLASTATAFALVVFIAAAFTQLRYETYIYYLFFTYAVLVTRSRQLYFATQKVENQSHAMEHSVLVPAR